MLTSTENLGEGGQQQVEKYEMKDCEILGTFFNLDDAVITSFYLFNRIQCFDNTVVLLHI